MKYSIHGKYILYQNQLIEGYICIKNEYIKHIVLEQDNAKLNKYPVKYSYDSQVIMSAGIDTNVSLGIWNHIEEFTKLAIIGGVSLILNKPYQLNRDVQPLEQFSQLVNQLQEKSQTDFIQISNVIEIQDIERLSKLGAFCFDCHLIQSYSGTMCKDNYFLQGMLQTLPQNSVLFIHTQSAVDKDLGITSPFRTYPFQERLNIQQLDLIDADGVSGTCISDDENIINDDPKAIQQLNYLDETNTPMKDIVKKYKNSDEKQISEFEQSDNIPSSPTLQSNVFKYKSKAITEESQIKLISRAELISYNEDHIPQMEQTYRFPNEICDNQISTADQHSKPEQDSPVDSKNNSNQHDSNQKFSPQMSVQSSDISSPESLSLKSVSRLRTRSHTAQGLLQRRQSKTGFALVLHQVENKNKHGSGDMLLQQQNFSETRPRENHHHQHKFNRDYLCFLAFRPATWEKLAINKIRRILKHTQFQCNIVFTGYSSSFSLVEIKELLSQKIYSDLGYPYLIFDSEDIQDGATKYKADPPIRQKYNKHLIQKAITQKNWISSISSQHMYINGLYKFEDQGDFRKAVSGLCTIGCMYQAVWTQLFCQKYQDPFTVKQAFLNKNINNPLYNRMVDKLCQLQQLVSTGPAQYLGLQDRGSIEVGKLADLVIFDPLKPWKFNFKKINLFFTFPLDKHILKDKHFLGSIEYVFIRGQLILNQENSQISVQNRKGLHIIK